MAQAPGAKELFAILNAMPEVRAIAEDKALAKPAFDAYLAKAFAKK